MTYRHYGVVLIMALAAPLSAAIANTDAALEQQDPAASANTSANTSAAAPKSCPIESPAGEKWLAENQWRYGNPDDPDPKKAKAARQAAAQAFETIVTGQSPWPNWFEPSDAALKVGTRFQMAMGPKDPTPVSKYGQKDDEPGGWGTFNNIRTKEDVRQYLAVLPEFKPEIDRINTYVVIIPMPVKMGPVGPQVEKDGCYLLPGGWSQFNILSDRVDRMKYLQLESSRKFDDLEDPTAQPASD